MTEEHEPNQLEVRMSIVVVAIALMFTTITMMIVYYFKQLDSIVFCFLSLLIFILYILGIETYINIRYKKLSRKMK